MDTIELAPAHAATLWAGLMVLLMLVLSALVVRQRRQHGVLLGHGDVPDLEQAIRAFGNAAEYVPVGLAMLALLVIGHAPALLVHGVGALLFLGRLAHGWGLSRSAGVTAGRSVGMVLTWLALLIGGVVLLFLSA